MNYLINRGADTTLFRYFTIDSAIKHGLLIGKWKCDCNDRTSLSCKVRPAAQLLAEANNHIYAQRLAGIYIKISRQTPSIVPDHKLIKIIGCDRRAEGDDTFLILIKSIFYAVGDGLV